MLRRHQIVSLTLILGIAAAPLMLASCMTSHHGYAETGIGVSVYDRGHNDYHTWNDGEVTFYAQWEGSTKREHQDFNRRNADEQRQYWDWRHSHS